MTWANALRFSSELALHHKDGRHASPIGAYFTACVFYAILTNKSPEGLPASFIIEGKIRPDQDELQALLLQKVAWETLRNSEVGMRNAE